MAKVERLVRALHVIGRMDRGGIETWLMQVLRNIDRRKIAIDFLVHTDRECAFDREIRSLGARILHCPHPLRPWLYGPQFRQLLRDNGPYDIVHSHMQSFSGYVLRLARKEGVPVLIAHSHTDTRGIAARSTVLHRQYRWFMDKWLNRHADIKLAASRAAAACLYGEDWAQDSNCKVLYYGLDFSPFKENVDRTAVRADFGLSHDAIVLAHAGRFVDAKNHSFLLDVALEIAKRHTQVYVLMLGDGPRREGIRASAAKLGLGQRVLLPGECANVARVLLACNGFIFPSLYEGLGLALVEAQAAGLPCICSERVPEDATLIPELVRRMRLSEGAVAWAEAILTLVSKPPALTRSEALARMTHGRFDVQTSVEDLTEVYASAIATSTRLAAKPHLVAATSAMGD